MSEINNKLKITDFVEILIGGIVPFCNLWFHIRFLFFLMFKFLASSISHKFC